MHKLFWALMMVLLLNCQNTDKKRIVVSKVQKSSLLGMWISEKYLSNLIKTKNSNVSSSGINLSLLDFKEDNKCSLIWNFYEGTAYEYSIESDSIILKSSVKTPSNLIFFINSDTLFDVKHNKYVKIGNDKIIEKYLFCGKYKEINSKSQVTFLENGTILGFGKFTTYGFEFQNSLRDSSLNIIYLNDEKFAYNFVENNRIELFKLNCEDISDDESCDKGECIAILEK